MQKKRKRNEEREDEAEGEENTQIMKVNHKKKNGYKYRREKKERFGGRKYAQKGIRIRTL